MDPTKIKTVQEQPIPRILRDLQAFLGFYYFYRRFITSYSAIAKPITALLSSEIKDTKYLQLLNSEYSLVFEQIKSLFSTTRFLVHFNPEKETQIGTDALDYIIVVVLSQFYSNRFLRPIAFLLSKMSLAEYNYEIDDKELLVIIRAFEEQRPELSSSTTPI